MRIVVIEYFSARPGGETSRALRRAGGALLHAVTEDLAQLPGVTVTVVPPSRRPVAEFGGRLAGADAALVIAPEAGGILARLLDVAEARGARLLGPGPRAARIAGDKLATSLMLARAGVPVPRCARLRLRDAGRRLRLRRRPFVVKPRDGCGAEGVSIVRRASDLDSALRRVRAVTRRRDVLVEDYVPGAAVSVSLLVRPGRSERGRAPGSRTRFAVLALGRQRIQGRSALRYAGGELPWSAPRGREAVRAAVRAVGALQRAAGDLRGFMGVDLVLGPRGASVIEINPRLTSSYLGLRRVLGPGPGRLLCEAALEGRNRGRVVTRGRVRFDAGGTVRAAVPRGRARTRR